MTSSYQVSIKKGWVIPIIGFVLMLIAFLAVPIFAREKVPEPRPDKKASQKQVAHTIHIALPKLNCTYCDWFAQLIYAEAFGRLGYAVELHSFPYERSLLETNAGRMDLEAGRIRFNNTLSARYPNLIRVDEPIRTIHLGAYTLDNTLQLVDWKDLTGRTLTIGYNRGIKLAEQRLAQHQVPAQHLHKFIDVRQGVRMLERRRIDVLLAFERPIAEVLDESEFSQVRIQLAGVMEEIPVFPYFHSNHHSLAPRLAETLKAMKTDGTIKRLDVLARQKTNETP